MPLHLPPTKYVYTNKHPDMSDRQAHIALIAVILFALMLVALALL
jgi:hypothetical protein